MAECNNLNTPIISLAVNMLDAISDLLVTLPDLLTSSK